MKNNRVLALSVLGFAFVLGIIIAQTQLHVFAADVCETFSAGCKNTVPVSGSGPAAVITGILKFLINILVPVGIAAAVLAIIFGAIRILAGAFAVGIKLILYALLAIIILLVAPTIVAVVVGLIANIGK